MNTEVYRLLREAADSAESFERDGSVFTLVRGGTEFEGELFEDQMQGVCVKEPDGSISQVSVYIQRNLFKLNYLAQQVLKKLEDVTKSQKVKFIDSPASIVYRSNQIIETSVIFQQLQKELRVREFGSTKLIAVMAPAGHGKTVLLQHLALESALAYYPVERPSPIVLPIDLLGRNVGNIDDAVAGSLNNTYSSPGLRHRDVLLCLKQGWLTLALDGFDELVARVGVSDAFSRLASLLEDLEGAGTVVLSARQSFFDTFEVAAAIQRFVKLSQGNYTMTSISLLRWTKVQAIEVFRNLKNFNPQATVENLLDSFQRDESIVFHPFFLTKLAELISSDSSMFNGIAIAQDHLGRAKWVIETFLRRELKKWTGKDGNDLLSMEHHITMLGGVAEEMWITGIFALRAEDLRLAALVGLTEAHLGGDVTDEVSNRISTHAAFIKLHGNFQFFHDQLRHFCFGHRISLYLARQKKHDLNRLLGSRVLSADVIDWAIWFLMQAGDDLLQVLNVLNDNVDETLGANALNENLARLIAALGCQLSVECKMKGQKFFGDAFFGKHYRQVRFIGCSFWQVDLRETVFEDCAFDKCEFSLIQIGPNTSFKGCSFDLMMKFDGIRSEEGWSAYSREEIVSKLIELGATVETDPILEINPSLKVPEEIVIAVERLVKSSSRTWDVAGEEFEEEFPEFGKGILKAGLMFGILRQAQRQTSGKSKEFYRFQVDRDALLRARSMPEEGSILTNFWKYLISEI